MNKPTLGNTIIGAIGMAVLSTIICAMTTAYLAIVYKVCASVWRMIV